METPLGSIPNSSRPGLTEGIHKHARDLLTAAFLSGVAAFGAATYRAAPARADSAAPQAPLDLSDQAQNLVTDTVEAWAQRQTPAGNFIDPVEGRVTGYGISMIGQAMVETGAATDDAALIEDGVKAELNELGQPDGGGFELFSFADAYTWNQHNLADNPVWQAASTPIDTFLQQHGERSLVDSAPTQQCYASGDCYDNLKLVTAYADILLTQAGLTTAQGGQATPAQAGSLPASARYSINQAVDNTGHDAARRGSMHFDDAGILSDPTRDPLAYHELSTMMLGRVIEALGSRTPQGVEAAFQRGARAIIGLMAPDGDGAYIGRGQGQVWNVAAMVDALATAAHHTSDPVWRGRYLAGVSRGLQRLQTDYTPGAAGLPLVPRLLNDPSPNYLGIDHYANTVQYDGLALWALQDAIAQLRETSPAPAETVGADQNGVFIDPSHTRFATVRKGDLWYAIHAADTSPDSRYDFGLVAAEHEQNGVWTPAMPYRPLTSAAVSGGPTLLSHGARLVPIGRSIQANPNGTVTVEGGWANQPGMAPHVDTRTRWLFQPLGDQGVKLSFETRQPHQNYQFEVFYEPGSQVVATPNSLTVDEPDGRHESYRFNQPVRISPGPMYHSAYDENLDSSILTLHTGAAGSQVTDTTLF